MFINEVIERADKLCENEYTIEEKYHWCDVVTAELKKSFGMDFKRSPLIRWRDDTFLLPQDCGYEYVEKFILGRRVIKKEDMRNFGVKFEVSGSGIVVRFPPDIFRKYIGMPDILDVVYSPQPRPIRRIELSKAWVKFPEKDADGKRTTLTMDNTCPFIVGDTVEISTEDTSSILHITKRTSDFDDINIKIYYKLEYGEGEADDFPEGEIFADMKRIVTDTTICGAPHDEMYIDYICAQICFYQRKTNMYQQFIERYNERFKEFGNMMKSYSPEQDYSQFRNWWTL